MNIRYLKMTAFVLALFFLSGCAVFIRDDYHHPYYRHWHSSLQQFDGQMTAQSSGDSVAHR